MFIDQLSSLQCRKVLRTLIYSIQFFNFSEKKTNKLVQTSGVFTKSWHQLGTTELRAASDPLNPHFSVQKCQLNENVPARTFHPENHANFFNIRFLPSSQFAQTIFATETTERWSHLGRHCEYAYWIHVYYSQYSMKCEFSPTNPAQTPDCGRGVI